MEENTYDSFSNEMDNFQIPGSTSTYEEVIDLTPRNSTEQFVISSIDLIVAFVIMLILFIIARFKDTKYLRFFHTPFLYKVYNKITEIITKVIKRKAIKKIRDDDIKINALEQVDKEDIEELSDIVEEKIKHPDRP